MLHLRFVSLFLALSVSTFLSSVALGETVLRFDFASSSTLRDVSFDTGVFSTIGDAGATLGTGQFTALQFDGFLDPEFADIGVNAEVSISGLQVNGMAQTFGTVIGQEFTGGTISVFDDMQTLLLSASLGDSTLFGSTVSGTAQLSNTSPVTFDGGTLLPFLDPNSGGLSVSMVNVRTGSLVGLRENAGVLNNFSADASGQIEAAAVIPEPLGGAFLGLLGIVAFAFHSRRRISFRELSACATHAADRRPRFLFAKLARRVSTGTLTIAVMVIGMTQSADAGVIIRANLNGAPTSVGDLRFENGELFTLDDGHTPIGDQRTDIEFESFLSPLFANIADLASFSLDGVMADGPVQYLGTGPSVFQETVGGTFRLYDSADSLLLEGELQTGLIAGSLTASTGGFMSTSPVIFTAGSLLPSLPLHAGDFSMTFSGIQSDAGAALSDAGGVLSGFRADGQVLIDSQPVPEPGTLAAFATLCLGGLVSRRIRL
ncbi:MAG: PEP-CTERM sorting domain-containing protein [Planctomycetota bacterium]